jgi:putative transposase
MAHRYRLAPTPDQLSMLARHCADARYVWNLALEQANYYRPGRPMPSSAERYRQLAEARRETWLGTGSSSVHKQALRDFDQALGNWWAGTHRRPPALFLWLASVGELVGGHPPPPPVA